MENFSIQNNVEKKRFEVQVDGHIGVLNYQQKDNLFQIDFVGVPSEIGGRGIGSELVRESLEYAQKEGLRPVPICGFARAYLQQHPEYQDSTGFYEIMSKCEPDIQELAFAARHLIFQIFPKVVEVPWVVQGTVGYGVGPKKMSEHFVWMSAHKKHVNLGFFYGAELPDPEQLLEGTGKLLRHVKIRKVEDLQNPALHELLRFATTYRMPEKPSASPRGGAAE